MPSRRVDDRILLLSARILELPNEEVEPVLQMLLEAIHEKMEHLRGLAISRFLGGEYPNERRAMPS